MIHVNITISGRVQKIGFRYSALQTALRLGIKGFVMNLHNGDVYIEAEGPENNMDELISWCNTGPPWAIVTRVVVEEADVKGFTSFEITSR